MTINI